MGSYCRPSCCLPGRADAADAQVTEPLKEIENGALRQLGGEAVDFYALRRELGLDDSLAGLGSYNADEQPAAARWLATDESLRIAAVESHHRGLPDHPDMPNHHLHAVMHVIVENQVAVDDLPEVRPTLKRLLDAGLARHEAVHAIGSVVAEALFKVMKEHAEFDRAFAARSLAKLRADDWRFAAQ